MGNFFDKDTGWKQFMAQARINSGETAGFVGYLRSAAPYQNRRMRAAEARRSGKPEKPAQPITVAQIAAINEFGNETTPERSFMRSALAQHAKEMKRLTKKLSVQVLFGKMTKHRAIGILCQKVIDWFAFAIDSNIPPPNAPSTVAAKGSSHTLIDTGQMKGSLDWEIREGKK
jgi:hypothetical protein